MPEGMSAALDRLLDIMRSIRDDGSCICGKNIGHGGWVNCVIDESQRIAAEESSNG